jgi:hypothetical protein
MVGEALVTGNIIEPQEWEIIQNGDYNAFVSFKKNKITALTNQYNDTDTEIKNLRKAYQNFLKAETEEELDILSQIPELGGQNFSSKQEYLEYIADRIAPLKASKNMINEQYKVWQGESLISLGMEDEMPKEPPKGGVRIDSETGKPIDYEGETLVDEREKLSIKRKQHTPDFIDIGDDFRPVKNKVNSIKETLKPSNFTDKTKRRGALRLSSKIDSALKEFKEMQTMKGRYNRLMGRYEELSQKQENLLTVEEQGKIHSEKLKLQRQINKLGENRIRTSKGGARGRLSFTRGRTIQTFDYGTGMIKDINAIPKYIKDVEDRLNNLIKQAEEHTK